MKTAVVLAARKEHDCEVPYPLQPFYEGTCLIDRTLGILRDFNFNNIFLVVGYKSELFQVYAADDVTLITNNDYEFTSSMGSLALLKDDIKEDFILIEGDTFYEKEVISKLTQITYGNGLVMTEESGSGDECFVETQSGFVTKITKDRHRVTRFEGELLGVSRISLNTYKKIIDVWEHAENPYLNYEYLFMDVTEPIERPVIYIQNLIWGEVDNSKDYKRLKNEVYPRLRRKEDPFDKENLLIHLGKIFPGHDVGNAIITKMGGMSNKNFHVELFGKNYVLRVPGFGSEGMVERANEEFNANEGAKLRVTPNTYYFDSQSGVKLTEYIENAETLNSATVQRHENMKQIASIYKTIHESHIRLRNEFNIFKEIEKYDVLIYNSGAVMYCGYESVRKVVMSLEGHLNKLGVELKPCHNDAVPENFIKSKNGKIYLIDWEYSGMNDPMADIAALFLESEFTEDNQDFFLLQYLGKSSQNIKEKILCYQILWDYLWAQWTIVKEAKGDNFGTYGIERFNRARYNIEKLQNLQ